jgi:WD40 repeat protein
MSYRLLPLFTLLLGSLVVSLADEPSEVEARAAVALRPLELKMADAATDLVKLRRDLVAFRVRHHGTLAAIKASTLMAKLPSALDKLDPKTVPEIERFDWHPKELVALLGEHRNRHGGVVSSVTFSPDGKLLATGGASYIRLWDTSNMRQLSMGTVGYATNAVALSSDKKILACSSPGGYVHVWDIVDGKTLKFREQFLAASAGLFDIAFHPDGKRIATACFDNQLRLYDLSEPKHKDLNGSSAHLKTVTAVSFSPDGRFLASGDDEGIVRIFDASKAEILEISLIENQSPIQSLTFSKTGTLATGGKDGVVRLWNMPPTGPRLRAPRSISQVSKGPVTSMSFSVSGKTLATAGSETTVRTWSLSVKPFKEINKIDDHKLPARAVAYSPDMKLLATGGDDWLVRTYDLSKGKPLHRFEPWAHTSHVYSTAFAPDDATLASGSYDRIVRFWDVSRPEPKTLNYLKGENAPVFAVAYSPDGKRIAAAGGSTKIRQWEMVKDKLVARPTLVGMNSAAVMHLEFSPDGKMLAGSNAKEAVIFDTKNFELQRFTQHETNVLSLAFTPDGKQFVTGTGYYLFDKDNKIVYKENQPVFTDVKMRFWDLQKGQLDKTFNAGDYPVYSLAVTPDSKRIFAGSLVYGARRWDIGDGKLTESEALKATSGYTMQIIPSPDGKTVITRGLEGKVIVWDLATGKRLKEFLFPEQLGGMSLTADGRHLAVGVGTGVVYVLRLAERGS